MLQDHQLNALLTQSVVVIATFPLTKALEIALKMGKLQELGDLRTFFPAAPPLQRAKFPQV